MKKKIVIAIVMLTVLITGCNKKTQKAEESTTTQPTTYNFEKETQNERDKYGQIRMYKDDELMITTEKYNMVTEGMTEQEVWQIIGGTCKNKHETNTDNPEETMVSYSCNGKGADFSVVTFMFKQGQLLFKIETGLSK